MSERTVWNNRLIDGAKLDALSLNAGNKIDTTSLGNGWITDTEFWMLDWARSNIQAQIDASNWTWSTPSLWTASYDGTCVIITNGNTIIRYCPTYIEYVVNWQITSHITVTGTYNATTWQMVYTDWTTVNNDWTVSGTDMVIAFQNKDNNFSKTNNFSWNTTFTGNVSIPYHDIGTGSTPNTIILDWDDGLSQKATVNWTSNLTLSFTNLRQMEYSLDLVVNDGCTLLIWTITNSGTITGKHALGWQIYPMALVAGTHIITIHAAELKIHVQVIESNPI